MLANLPAKRAPRQIFPNLTLKAKKKTLVPAAGRNKILVKQIGGGNRGFKLVKSSTTISSVGNNIALRRKRNAEGIRIKKASEVAVELRRTRSSLNTTATATATTTSIPATTEANESKTKPPADKSIKSDNNKNETDLSQALRRRTKTMVTKITNKFRRGNQKRLMKSNTAGKLAQSTGKDGQSETKSKASFLRQLSFRRSKRNAKTVERPTDEKPETNETDTKKVEMATPEANAVLAEEVIETPAAIELPSAIIEIDMTLAKEENLENAVKANVIANDSQIDNPVESKSKQPQLKRKKSLKSIINNIRNKCQQKQTTDLPTASIPEDLDQPVDLTISLPSVASAVAPSLSAPSNARREIPLVTIDIPLDEPINLSLKRRQSTPPPVLPLLSPASIPSPTPSSLPSPSLSLTLTPTKLMSPTQPPTTPTSSVDRESSVTSPPLTPRNANENTPSRRRTKKLNDCIAMLTGKLSEKLGVPFLEPAPNILPVSVPTTAAPSATIVSQMGKQPATAVNKQTSDLNALLSLNVKKDDKLFEYANITNKTTICDPKTKDFPKTTKELNRIVERLNTAKELREQISHTREQSIHSVELHRRSIAFPINVPLPQIIVSTMATNEKRPARDRSIKRLISEDAMKSVEYLSTKPSEIGVNLCTNVYEKPSASSDEYKLYDKPKKDLASEAVEKTPEKILKRTDAKPASPSRSSPRNSPRNSPRKLAENLVKCSQLEIVKRHLATKPDDSTEKDSRKELISQINQIPLGKEIKLISKPILSNENRNLIIAKTFSERSHPISAANESLMDLLEDFEANIAQSVIEKKAFMKEIDVQLPPSTDSAKETDATQSKKKSARQSRKRTTPSSKKVAISQNRTAPEIPQTMSPVNKPAVAMQPVDRPAVTMPPVDKPAATMPPVDKPAVALPPVDKPAMDVVAVDVVAVSVPVVSVVAPEEIKPNQIPDVVAIEVLSPPVVEEFFKVGRKTRNSEAAALPFEPIDLTPPKKAETKTSKTNATKSAKKSDSSEAMEPINIPPAASEAVHSTNNLDAPKTPAKRQSSRSPTKKTDAVDKCKITEDTEPAIQILKTEKAKKTVVKETIPPLAKGARKQTSKKLSTPNIGEKKGDVSVEPNVDISASEASISEEKSNKGISSKSAPEPSLAADANVCTETILKETPIPISAPAAAAIAETTSKPTTKPTSKTSNKSQSESKLKMADIIVSEKEAYVADNKPKELDQEPKPIRASKSRAADILKSTFRTATVEKARSASVEKPKVDVVEPTLPQATVEPELLGKEEVSPTTSKQKPIAKSKTKPPLNVSQEESLIVADIKELPKQKANTKSKNKEKLNERKEEASPIVEIKETSKQNVSSRFKNSQKDNDGPPKSTNEPALIAEVEENRKQKPSVTSKNVKLFEDNSDATSSIDEVKVSSKQKSAAKSKSTKLIKDKDQSTPLCAEIKESPRQKPTAKLTNSKLIEAAGEPASNTLEVEVITKQKPAAKAEISKLIENEGETTPLIPEAEVSLKQKPAAKLKNPKLIEDKVEPKPLTAEAELSPRQKTPARSKSSKLIADKDEPTSVSPEISNKRKTTPAKSKKSKPIEDKLKPTCVVTEVPETVKQKSAAKPRNSKLIQDKTEPTSSFSALEETPKQKFATKSKNAKLSEDTSKSTPLIAELEINPKQKSPARSKSNKLIDNKNESQLNDIENDLSAVTDDKEAAAVKEAEAVTPKLKPRTSNKEKSKPKAPAVPETEKLNAKSIQMTNKETKVSEEPAKPSATSSKRKSVRAAAVKKASNSKQQKEFKPNFESDDDELLPWDPETGFVQPNAKKEKIEADPAKEEPSPLASEPLQEEPTPIVQPKMKKKRKSELAQIIADQLLESFKEVDESRLTELKKISDLSNCEDLLSTTFSSTPIPKRRAKQVANDVASNLKVCAEEVSHVNEEKALKKSSKSVSRRSKTPAIAISETAPKNTETDNIIEPDSKEKKLSKKDLAKRKKLEESTKDDVSISSQSTETPTKTTTLKSRTTPANSRKSKKSAVKNTETPPIESKPQSTSKSKLETTSSEQIEEKNIFLAEISKSVFKETLHNQIAPNEAQIILPNKSTDKELFNSSEASSNKSVPDFVAQILDDFTNSTVESKSSSSNVFTESIFTASTKSNSLSDLFNKSTATSGLNEAAKLRAPKNKLVDSLITFDKINNSTARAPFMSPHWEMEEKLDNIATTATTAAAPNTKLPLVTDNKMNFWSRSKDEVATGKKRIFGLVKNKTKKILDKMTKRKLKKSLKTSISSSSSSSSSSCPSPSHSVAKKPILRPSILSCKAFGEVPDATDGTTKTSVPADAEKTKNLDVFDALKMSVEPPVVKPVLAQPVLSRKMGSMRRRTGKVAKETIDVDGPKSPIESDMNIAKIAIALDSNRKEKLKHDETTYDKLNDAFRVDSKAKGSLRESRRDKKLRKTPEKQSPPKAQPSTLLMVDISQAPCSTSNVNDDSSQDTIISQIVNKIRENVNRTDSDDDLCLADVAKGINRKSFDDDFDSASVVELSESRMETSFSALVSDINKRLESPASDDRNTPLDSGLADEDENTNTELVDMDLEDNISVYTGISLDTSIASGGTGSENRKKKRKKKSILYKGRKVKKIGDEFVSPSQNHFCELCNKSFKKLSALNSHKTTISHISKVSELEFLDSKKKESESPAAVEDPPSLKDDTKPVTKEKLNTIADNKLENKENLESGVIPEKSTLQKSPSLVSLPQKSPALETITAPAVGTTLFPSPNHNNSYPSQNSFEPISSPEQSSRFNTTPKQHSSMSTANSRMALSQEERLFYECCSMLKGSERTASLKSELVPKTVTPKTSEQNTNIAHSAQSPRSRSSPRPGIPKIDLDNFSDMSSDSNPAYSCPQVPSSSKTQKVFSLEENAGCGRKSSKTNNPSETGTPIVSFFKKSIDSEIEHRHNKNSTTYPNSSLIVRNYPDTYSDMGDSFPSSQDASESENYAQTILERSNNVHSTLNSLRTAASPKYELNSFGIAHGPPSFSNRYVR